MHNEHCDIFLCYRRRGAQTAKLFKRYLEGKGYFDGIWYSDDMPYGNYKTDVHTVVFGAKCAVIMISRDFTEGFLTGDGHINDRSYIDEQGKTHFECITVQEMIEIERRIQEDAESGNPTFRILTVYLDTDRLSDADQQCLSEVFRLAGILREDSVAHFTQSNINTFNTARDYEEELFNKLSGALVGDDYFGHKLRNGNFFFGNVPTSVDIIIWDVDGKLPPEGMQFSLYSRRDPDMYRAIKNKRADVNNEVQNDSMISVVDVDCFLSDNDENKLITVKYIPIEYSLFYKTLQLKSANQCNINRFLSDYRYGDNDDIYAVPNAMGLALMVVTRDGYLVFSKRSAKRGIRKGEYDCSIVEGLRLEVDDYTVDSDDYILRECRRAYCEEIIADGGNIDVRINGVVLDRDYGQWNVIGTVFADKTAAELDRLHSTRADTYERNRLFFVPIRDAEGVLDLNGILKKVAEFRRTGLWDMALVVLYAALHMVGFTAEELAAINDSALG